MDELNFDGKTILVVGGPIGISLQRGLVAVSRYQLVSWVGGASIGMIAASTAGVRSTWMAWRARGSAI